MRGQNAADGFGRIDSRSGEEEALRLLAHVRARELWAFEALYRSFHPRLSRFLTNLMRRPQLIEEVLNDTMLVLWNSPDSFRGSSKLSTWIFAIAYRKALKALRRFDAPVEDRGAEWRASTDPGPDQALDGARLHGRLADALHELSPVHRTVIDLTYFHELSYRDIAEVMGCPVDTVKTRMFHARRHLRRILAGELADWI